MNLKHPSHLQASIKVCKFTYMPLLVSSLLPFLVETKNFLVDFVNIDLFWLVTYSYYSTLLLFLTIFFIRNFGKAYEYRFLNFI